MSISKYEAASLYDFVQQELSSQKEYLVIDLDDSSCGYCICNGKADLQLSKCWAESNKNLWSELLDSIKNMLAASQVIDLEAEVEKQLISANKALHNYFLSGKTLNSDAFSFPGSTISCAELDEKLSVLKEEISNLISHALELVAPEKVLHVNIIILGKAQELYLVMYYIREQLSYDPMLPDERFRNAEFKDHYTDIVKKGEMLFEAMTALKHTYSLLAFNPESNSFDTVYTVSKEEAKSNPAELVFSEPILLCDDDKLSIKADDSILNIPLPYTIAPSQSDLIDAAIGLNHNEDTLFIRRCRFPTRIYSVKLS